MRTWEIYDVKEVARYLRLPLHKDLLVSACSSAKLPSRKLRCNPRKWFFRNAANNCITHPEKRRKFINLVNYLSIYLKCNSFYVNFVFILLRSPLGTLHIYLCNLVARNVITKTGLHFIMKVKREKFVKISIM